MRYLLLLLPAFCFADEITPGKYDLYCGVSRCTYEGKPIVDLPSIESCYNEAKFIGPGKYGCRQITHIWIDGEPAPDPDPIPDPTPDPVPDPVPDPTPDPDPDPDPDPVPPPTAGDYPGIPMPNWDYNSPAVNARRVTGGTSITFNGSPSNIDYVDATGVTFSQNLDLRGQYGVLIGGRMRGVDGALSYSGHHIAVRGADIHDSDNGNGAGIGGHGSDFILMESIVTGAGADRWNGNDDHHCWKLGGNRIWSIGNRFSGCVGDAIQVGDQNNTPGAIKDVFIIGNHAENNNQTGFWVKNATNVIIAYNSARNHNRGGDSVAASSGGQYKLTNVWWMFNDFDNSPVGIRIASTDGGSGRYYIKNKVRTNKAPSSNTFGDGWHLQSWSSSPVVAIHNDAESAVGARAALVGYNPLVTTTNNVNFNPNYDIKAVQDIYKTTFGVEAPF